MNEILTIIAENDSPFTCPYDGARTEFLGVSNNVYAEACPHCGNVFNFEFDEE